MSLENSPNSSAEFGEFSKLKFKRFFSPNSRVEFGDFLQTQGLSLEIFSKLKFKISKLIFFKKKSKFKKYTHSEVEFGDFPELRFKRNKIPKTCFFSKTKMSLENSPNSSAEFGEFSKLRFKRIFFWVWRTLQTQESSLENSPNTRVEFGEFSKLKFEISKFIFFCKTMNWKKSKTQRLSLENSPNSDSKERFLWLWRNLQTQGLSLENSPNSGSKSPNSFVSQKNPNSEVEFGVFSKLNGWEFSKLRLFSKTPATLNPKLYGQRPAAWN